MDYSKYTKEEKKQLYELLKEKERRLKASKQAYTPHAAQLEVHSCDKQIRAVFSGNGAGKTCLGANEAVVAADGYNPWLKKFTPSPSRGIIVLDSPSKVDDVWLPELQKWIILDHSQLNKRGKPYYTQVTFPNGSEILFMFHDQSPLLFESIEADWVIFDEPPPRKIYVALMRGLRKIGSMPWILFLGTPITASWMRRELYEPWAKGEADHIEVFRFDSDSNKENINWKWYEKVYFKNLSDKEIRVRRHGEFFDQEGLALSHLFNRETHLMDDFEWPDGHPVVLAIDPHPSKNHVAVLVGSDREGFLYYLDELSSSAPPSQFADELKEFMKGYRVLDVICDSLGSTPGTGGDGNMTFIEKLNSRGIRARATSYKEKSDEDFIQRIRQVLEVSEKEDNFGRRIPKLRIIKGNPGIIGDIENVEWLKYRDDGNNKPKLNISNRDFLACLKYALSTSITVIQKKPAILRTKAKSPFSGVGKYRSIRR